MEEKNKLQIYTDGAFSSNRQQGGWAFVIVNNDKIIYQNAGHDTNTETHKVTNNTMEMMAVYEALKSVTPSLLKKNLKCDLISDSLYVLNTLRGRYEIKTNIELWNKIMQIDLSNYNLIHVRGHQGNKYNEICDTLAVMQSHVESENFYDSESN